MVTSATYIQTNIVPDGDGLFNGGSSSVTTVNVTISPTPSAGDGITCEGVWGNNTSTATISDPTGACSTALPSFYNGATFSTSQAWKCNEHAGRDRRQFR